MVCLLVKHHFCSFFSVSASRVEHLDWEERWQTGVRLFWKPVVILLVFELGTTKEMDHMKALVLYCLRRSCVVTVLQRSSSKSSLSFSDNCTITCSPCRWQHKENTVLCRSLPVSYTHLDVYKRQHIQWLISKTIGPRTHQFKSCTDTNILIFSISV